MLSAASSGAARDQTLFCTVPAEWAVPSGACCTRELRDRTGGVRAGMLCRLVGAVMTVSVAPPSARSRRPRTAALLVLHVAYTHTQARPRAAAARRSRPACLPTRTSWRAWRRRGALGGQGRGEGRARARACLARWTWRRWSRPRARRCWRCGALRRRATPRPPRPRCSCTGRLGPGQTRHYPTLLALHPCPAPPALCGCLRWRRPLPRLRSGGPGRLAGRW